MTDMVFGIHCIRNFWQKEDSNPEFQTSTLPYSTNKVLDQVRRPSRFRFSDLSTLQRLGFSSHITNAQCKVHLASLGSLQLYSAVKVHGSPCVVLFARTQILRQLVCCIAFHPNRRNRALISIVKKQRCDQPHSLVWTHVFDGYMYCQQGKQSVKLSTGATWRSTLIICHKYNRRQRSKGPQSNRGAIALRNPKYMRLETLRHTTTCRATRSHECRTVICNFGRDFPHSQRIPVDLNHAAVSSTKR